MTIPIVSGFKSATAPNGKRGSGTVAKKVLTSSIVCLFAALVCIVIGGAVLTIGGSQGKRHEKTVEDLLKEGDVYTTLGSYQDALSCYSSAFEVDSSNIDAQRGMGKSYVALEQLDKAEDIYTSIVNLPSDNPEDALELINLKLQAGEMEEAKSLTKSMMDRFGDEGFSSLYEQMIVTAPTFNITSGSYEDYQLLELVDVPENTVVYYTLDGSLPDKSSDEYKAPIPLTAPYNFFRAVAISYLGFESDYVDIDVEITREPKAVEFAAILLNNFFEDKDYSDTVYDWEIASITEFHIVGSFWPYNHTRYVGSFHSNGYEFGGTFYNEPTEEDLEYSDMILDMLAYMPYLRKLSVCYQTSFDLERLSNLHYLEELALVHDHIESLGGSYYWPTSLRRLSLGWNYVSDVSALSELTSLETLGLWSNNIESINSLSFLNELNHLDVSHNRISDVSVVSNMPQLSELWINNNAIEDLTPVNTLTNLRKLMQGGNPGSNTGLDVELVNQLKTTDYTRGDE